MTSVPNLNELTPEQLRALAAQLLSQVDTMGKKILRDEVVIEQLAHCVGPPGTSLAERFFAQRIRLKCLHKITSLLPIA
ncbi:hypothetical protein IEG05_00400 [Pseudomonas kunmingensis]|uniref:hypothetical protein n=1 Tax=Stutzerimonas kunmingensis TaxID=1211807 RepID=UPI001746A5C4|nr:hypothetical protein [Stutzerimonas kunmingensis]MBD3873695.1 hypothetical protein [Stutzerimonas kunmingensis]